MPGGFCHEKTLLYYFIENIFFYLPLESCNLSGVDFLAYGDGGKKGGITILFPSSSPSADPVASKTTVLAHWTTGHPRHKSGR